MTNNFPNAVASIHKRGYKSSAPWCIDIRWEDGSIWQSWGYDFRTKKAAVEHCKAVGVKVLS